MRRRDFLKTASLSLLATQGAFAAKASPQKKPNILFIFTDDHAYQAVSAYGSRINKTPNIDRIANEGMIFENSFVTNSICAPSRGVIQTGKHSHLNGQFRNGLVFDTKQQTFPKILQKNGYETALIGKWHLKANPTGFNHWEVLDNQGTYYNPDFLSTKGRKKETGYVTHLITDKSLNWLEKGRNKDKPFMLMLQHKAPHRDWKPGPDHLTTYDDVDIPEPPTLFDDYKTRGTAAKAQKMSIGKDMWNTYDFKLWDPAKPLSKKEQQWVYGRMNEEQKKVWNKAYEPKNATFFKNPPRGKALLRWKYQRYLKNYLRCIASVDDSIGQVLTYLEKSGLDKNTLVMYASDQGFYLGEHGWYDKRFIYEESLRTPLMARWPNVIKPGSRNKSLVQNLDYAQTFLDAAGVPEPEDMQGMSLVPLMKGEKTNWRTSIYYQYYEGERRTHKVYKHYGLRTDRYKLVYFYTLDEWEFYDLKKDPLEIDNGYMKTEYQKTIAQLKEELQRLRLHYKVPEDTDIAKR